MSAMQTEGLGMPKVLVQSKGLKHPGSLSSEGRANERAVGTREEGRREMIGVLGAQCGGGGRGGWAMR